MINLTTFYRRSGQRAENANEVQGALRYTLLHCNFRFRPRNAITVHHDDVDAWAPIGNIHLLILLSFVNFLAVDLPAKIIVTAQPNVFIMLGVFEFQGKLTFCYWVGVGFDGNPSDFFLILFGIGNFIKINKQIAITQRNKTALRKARRAGGKKTDFACVLQGKRDVKIFVWPVKLQPWF